MVKQQHELEGNFSSPRSGFATARTKLSTLKRTLHDWRNGSHFGSICCTLTVGIVLLINVVGAVVAATRRRTTSGIGVLQHGDCSNIKSLDQWLHLLINILSTALLGATSYCMQCLSAPTRRDIDKAHQNYVWMDIGVQSVRNILRISWPRKILWLLLLVSSIPIHLVYNSVLFSSVSFSQFEVFLVASNFPSTRDYNETTPALNPDFRISVDDFFTLNNFLRNQSAWHRIENKDCIETYGGPLVLGVSDVIVVSTQPNISNAVLDIIDVDYNHNYVSDSAWICNKEGKPYVGEFWEDDQGECDVRDAAAKAEEWIINKNQISHCLIQPVEEHCELRYSMPFMVVVLACNLIKLLCTTVLAWKFERNPLVTIGDAIASFLDNPDPTTKDLCLASKAHFQSISQWRMLPLYHHTKDHSWFASASSNQWQFTTTICVIALALASTFLSIGVYKPVAGAVGASYMFSLGFGAIVPAATIRFRFKGVTAMAMIANTPQLLLCLLYFMYNGLYTSMLLAEEWSGYAMERKPLRVTSPRGKQRSTYRLQLPYRYGIPLLCMSSLLHWLVSQSIFLVILDAYRTTGIQAAWGEVITCGYSPIAILTTIIVGSITVILGIAVSCRRLRSQIPLAGSCSAAISAACHPPTGDDAASKKAILWGVCKISDGEQSVQMISLGLHPTHGQTVRKESPARVGHCSFTSFEVDKTIEGNLYAGRSGIVDVFEKSKE